MPKFQNILLLDDSEWILEEVEATISAAGYLAIPALTAQSAEQILKKNKIDFAIVDLFLLGDEGAELSNDFIAQHLTDIPYLRLTGDPQSVPKNLQGCGVLSKQAFRNDPSLLLDIIEEAENH